MRTTVDGVVLVVLYLDGRWLVDRFQVFLRAVAAGGRLDGAVTAGEWREREEGVDGFDGLPVTTTAEHAATQHQTDDEQQYEQRNTESHSQTDHHWPVDSWHTHER